MAASYPVGIITPKYYAMTEKLAFQFADIC
jgi:hypothetical protein